MARVTVKALEERIAALEARLEIARRVYRDQRVRVPLPDGQRAWVYRDMVQFGDGRVVDIDDLPADIFDWLVHIDAIK